MNWRLIYSGFMGGAENMALDEALLHGFGVTGVPVFRLYGWEPAAVSIGRFQKTEFLDMEKCHSERIPVVRRMTGGGMIYHHKELTYSIICGPEHLGVGRKPVDAYRKVCGFLLEFYRRLGFEADFAVNVSAETRRDNFCYGANEDYDIIINGKKIGGNAQRWLKAAVFQHGSIPVESCVADACGLVKGGCAAENTVSLRELGIQDSYSELYGAMQGSFFAPLMPDMPSEAELKRAEVLLSEKYANSGWNLRADEDH